MKLISKERNSIDDVCEKHLERKLFNCIRGKCDSSDGDVLQIVHNIIKELDKEYAFLIRR